MGPRASIKGVVAGQAACHKSALVSNKMEVTYISDELAVVPSREDTESREMPDQATNTMPTAPPQMAGKGQTS